MQSVHVRIIVNVTHIFGYVAPSCIMVVHVACITYVMLSGNQALGQIGRVFASNLDIF